MRAVATAAIALLAAGAAGAQCVGDANGNGTVEVNEAVLVVNNLLNGCPGGSMGCPYTFHDDVIGAPRLCAFNGTQSGAACRVDDLRSFLISDGSTVVLILDTDPLVGLAAEPLPGHRGAHEASLTGWYTDPVTDFHPISGTMTLAGDGRSMRIDPTMEPISIEGCGFGLYTPTYDGQVSRAAATSAAAPMSEPLPNFSRVQSR